MKTTSHIIAIIALLTFIPAITTLGEILETWESGTLNAGVNGDLVWVGDTAAYDVASAIWPTDPAIDFEGDRSLRSENHDGTNPQTIVTRIDSQLAFHKDLTWSVFFSGNSVIISPSRRADFIVLADTSDVNDIEDPGTINGYKVTLWDPYATATDNTPTSSHEDSTLGDSLALWSVDEDDDRWRVIGALELGATATDNLRDGWNIKVTRKNNGDWYLGYSNGAYGTKITNWTLVGSDTVPMSVFSNTAVYAGVGWLAPDNTENDHTDFGFDNFHIPEPATISLIGLLGAFLGFRRNFKG